MKVRHGCALLMLAVGAGGCATSSKKDLDACAALVSKGFRPIADERTERFLGKVQEDTARCRGGDKAVASRPVPWVDWQNYWATGDAKSRQPGSSSTSHLRANGRGVDGALLDLEYQRVELIKFNLFDNTGTYVEYVRGRDGVAGPGSRICAKGTTMPS